MVVIFGDLIIYYTVLISVGCFLEGNGWDFFCGMIPFIFINVTEILKLSSLHIISYFSSEHMISRNPSYFTIA